MKQTTNAPQGRTTNLEPKTYIFSEPQRLTTNLDPSTPVNCMYWRYGVSAWQKSRVGSPMSIASIAYRVNLSCQFSCLCGSEFRSSARTRNHRSASSAHRSLLSRDPTMPPQQRQRRRHKWGHFSDDSNDVNVEPGLGPPCPEAPPAPPPPPQGGPAPRSQRPRDLCALPSRRRGARCAPAEGDDVVPQAGRAKRSEGAEGEDQALRSAQGSHRHQTCTGVAASLVGVGRVCFPCAREAFFGGRRVHCQSD